MTVYVAVISLAGTRKMTSLTYVTTVVIMIPVILMMPLLLPLQPYPRRSQQTLPTKFQSIPTCCAPPRPLQERKLVKGFERGQTL